MRTATAALPEIAISGVRRPEQLPRVEGEENDGQPGSAQSRHDDRYDDGARPSPSVIATSSGSSGENAPLT